METDSINKYQITPSPHSFELVYAINVILVSRLALFYWQQEHFIHVKGVSSILGGDALTDPVKKKLPEFPPAASLC